MRNTEGSVERHYGRETLMDSILGALRELGKDLGRLAPSDLAPVDEFHIRGREATVELAKRAALRPGLRVLDVGSGIGGSARYLAVEHRCRVTGIDLTPEYVDAANSLAKLVGLEDEVEFRQGSALDMPFEDGAFDVVWTEHVQMNIADKRAFYAEIARVLTPGGRLLFHDIFQGPNGPPHYPVPWAQDSSISFLTPPETVRTMLDDLGLRILDWEDKTRHSLNWFSETTERIKQSGPPPLGTHLLMGGTAATKFGNVMSSLQEGRLVVIQALAEKT